jgi:hypothetical protein
LATALVLLPSFYVWASGVFGTQGKDEDEEVGVEFKM